MAAIFAPLFFPARARKKMRTIKLPRNYNDTSGARYAINEHGFLEEIQHDKLSSHAN